MLCFLFLTVIIISVARAEEKYALFCNYALPLL